MLDCEVARGTARICPRSAADASVATSCATDIEDILVVTERIADAGSPVENSVRASVASSTLSAGNLTGIAVTSAVLAGVVSIGVLPDVGVACHIAVESINCDIYIYRVSCTSNPLIE